MKRYSPNLEGRPSVVLNADCKLTAFVWNLVLSKGNMSTDIIAVVVQPLHATILCMPATTAVVVHVAFMNFILPGMQIHSGNGDSL